MDGFTVSTPYEPIIEENQREFKSPKMSLKIDNLLSKYPEWQDEDTRVTLLASFSQPRHVNPEAYDQRLNFWRHVIFEVLNHQIICTSIFALPNVDELSMRLSNCDPTGRRPHGLGHVIASMIGDSLAIPFPDTKRLFQDAGMFYPRQNRRSL